MLLHIHQRLLQWRAERLLGDLQAIELHKTTWSEAQILMRRWGAWGQYVGTCTAENCRYTITLNNWEMLRFLAQLRWTQKFLPKFLDSQVGQWLGGRSVHCNAGFIVQDNTVWRTTYGCLVNVPAQTGDEGDLGYGLIAMAQSRSSLNRFGRSKESHWILGSDEQLAEHPYYKAGRPGGCEICMAVEVTYSVFTPQDEVRRLTSFDLSCISRWRPCVRVEDLLSSAKPWHLYRFEGDPPDIDLAITEASPCSTPVWALGRDAVSVFSVEVLSKATLTREYDGSSYEQDKARLIETLKGEAPWPSQNTLTVNPYPGESYDRQLQAGKRYLLLVWHPFSGFESEPAEIDGVPTIRLDRCGVLEDTSANRTELARGFSQNDSLRVPEF